MWSRRSLHRFYGRGQTYGNRSYEWNSRKPLHVTQTFETKILRSDWFAQVNLISAAPTLQILRIGLSGGDRVARARSPWSSVEAGPKCSKIKGEKTKQHSCHLRKLGACLSQLLNLENENLLSTPAGRCMISKKNLISAEMDTLTKSCSPTIVITANGEVQTHEEAIVYVKELDFSWLWKSSITRQQYCRSESFAMKTDIPANGSMVKNHISLKTGFGYPATRKTSFRTWFLAYQRVLPQACLHQLYDTFKTRE